MGGWLPASALPGEFGVSEEADGEARALWTRAVAREAEQLCF